jgi:hypothetical protein
MEAPFSKYPVDFKLLGMVIITFLYGIIYAGLPEEPGWRGIALPRLQAKFSPFVSSQILWIFGQFGMHRGDSRESRPRVFLIRWLNGV